MEIKEYYPRVEVYLSKLRNNIDQIQSRCKEQGVEVAGVIKGFNGIIECAKEFESAGCQYIATSRIEQLRAAKESGIKTPLMLIRVPMLSEVDEAVKLADISLNSSPVVLMGLDKAAERQKIIHDVILMVDLGDLREGFWDKQEMLKAALMVDNDLHSLRLAGVGTNLGCYGSIEPTVEKLNELVKCAEMIEAKIGRKLDIISGGASTSMPRIFDKNIPNRINQLRIGEAIVNAKDSRDLFGYDMDFMYQDAFVLMGEVIEVETKPSYPVGKICYDAFGMKKEYKDSGMRRKALLAIGKVDYAFPDMIYPRERGVEVMGASSDHTILDVEDAEREIEVGDIVEFNLCYATIVFATNSPNVKIIIKN